MPAEIVWLIILVLGVGTFLIRVSFIQLFGFLDEIPDPIENALRFIPVAVLTAIVVPHMVSIDTGFAPSVSEGKLLAGVAAAAVAWKTENMLATIGVGMGVLWAITFLF